MRAESASAAALENRLCSKWLLGSRIHQVKNKQYVETGLPSFINVFNNIPVAKC